MDRGQPDLLLGRRAIVLGARGAIGSAVARRFRSSGASVVGADLEGGPDVLMCDVTDESSVARLFELVSDGGAVTDVVYAAGVLSIGAIRESSLSEWQMVLDSNLTGAFLVARQVARALESQSTATFIASQAGFRGAAGWAAYSAAKAGVLRLAESLAQELAPRGIRVNSVCPGSVETPMLRRSIALIAARDGISQDAVADRYRRGVPMGRFADPDEIAGVCVALASPLMSYVAGASIPVDGGELSA